MEDDLVEAGIYQRRPFDDALVPYFHLWGVSPEELLDHHAAREAYLARYGRIAPSEIRDMNPEHVERLVYQVSDLIEREYKARAGNPLDMPEEGNE